MMSKLDIQRRYIERFRSLGFNMPEALPAPAPPQTAPRQSNLLRRRNSKAFAQAQACTAPPVQTIPQTPEMKLTEAILECDHTKCMLSLDQVIDNILKTCADLLPCENASIYLYDQRSRMLSLQGSTHPVRQENIKHVKFSPGLGIVGRCYCRKSAVAFEKPGEVQHVIDTS
jgi:hypothetical protein